MDEPLKGRVEVTPDAAALVAAAVRAVVGIVEEAPAGRTVRVALAGGGTPRPVYEALARLPLPWSRLRFFVGDERAVPPEHPDSNHGMAARALGAAGPVELRRPEAESPDPEAAAHAYAEELAEPLDLCILGMGEDGHVASLFPGRFRPDDPRRALVVEEAPKPPPRRIGIGPRVIAEARAILVLAAGAGKAEAAARALEGPWDPAATPAQLARGGHWILDREAAARLRAARP